MHAYKKPIISNRKLQAFALLVNLTNSLCQYIFGLDFEKEKRKEEAIKWKIVFVPYQIEKKSHFNYTSTKY